MQPVLGSGGEHYGGTAPLQSACADEFERLGKAIREGDVTVETVEIDVRPRGGAREEEYRIVLRRQMETAADRQRKLIEQGRGALGPLHRVLGPLLDPVPAASPPVAPPPAPEPARRSGPAEGEDFDTWYEREVRGS